VLHLTHVRLLRVNKLVSQSVRRNE